MSFQVHSPENNHFQILLTLQSQYTWHHLINSPRYSSLILLRPFSPCQRDQNSIQNIQLSRSLFKPSPPLLVPLDQRAQRNDHPSFSFFVIHLFSSRGAACPRSFASSLPSIVRRCTEWDILFRGALFLLSFILWSRLPPFFSFLSSKRRRSRKFDPEGGREKGARCYRNRVR